MHLLTLDLRFFLPTETKEFVSDLFDALKTKIYLPNPPPQVPVPQPVSNNSLVPTAAAVETVGDNNISNQSEHENIGTVQVKQEPKDLPPRKLSSDKVSLFTFAEIMVIL